MKKIEILDCTLRDGGYINNWEFGLKNMYYVINTLVSPNINYIECGFISSSKNNCNNLNQSIFNNVKDLNKLINKYGNSKFALMMLTDNYDIEQLPNSYNNPINIIRLSFHKKDINKAIEYAFKIKEKGYRLFLQPTVVMSYSEIEIIKLLTVCNNLLKPEGVAIVDTLGEMENESVKRITKLFDDYLNKEIKLLFHGHNNLQMAFSNAITFIENVSDERNIIIDTTLMGMGKDAGNVCTELMTFYLNEYFKGNYDYEKILEIINNIIIKFKSDFEWGYTPEFMLNAKNKTHPSYGRFFRDNIKNINLMDLNYLLDKIPSQQKSNFNRDIAIDILNEFNKNNFNHIK